MVGVLCKRAGNLKSAENYIVFVLMLHQIMKTAAGLTQPMVGVLCKRAGNLKSAENYIVFVLILHQIMKTA